MTNHPSPRVTSGVEMSLPGIDAALVESMTADLQRTVVQPRGQERPCTVNREIFLTLDEPPTASSTQDERNEYSAAREVAGVMCETRCPHFESCLRQAVTGLEVEGFVAGTTMADRSKLRRALQVTPVKVNMARIAGAPEGHSANPRQVEEILTRAPQISLTDLSRKLGVSTATAKRVRRQFLDGELAPAQAAVVDTQCMLGAYDRIVTDREARAS